MTFWGKSQGHNKLCGSMFFVNLRPFRYSSLLGEVSIIYERFYYAIWYCWWWISTCPLNQRSTGEPNAGLFWNMSIYNYTCAHGRLFIDTVFEIMITCAHGRLFIDTVFEIIMITCDHGRLFIDTVFEIWLPVTMVDYL